MRQAQGRNRCYNRSFKDLCELQLNEAIRIQVQNWYMSGVVVKWTDEQ